MVICWNTVLEQHCLSDEGETTHVCCLLPWILKCHRLDKTDATTTMKWTYSVMGSLVIVLDLLQIFSWFWERNNFKNRLIFDEVKVHKTVRFLGHPTLYFSRQDFYYVYGNIDRPTIFRPYWRVTQVTLQRGENPPSQMEILLTAVAETVCPEKETEMFLS